MADIDGGHAARIVVRVPLPGRAYDIVVGRGLLDEAGPRVRELGARAARLLVQRLAAPAPGATDAPGAGGDGGPRRRRATAPRPLPVRLVARGTTARVEAA